MNDKIITGRGINALAGLLHELRPDWHEPGIVDALAKATDNARCVDGRTLALASVRAASEVSNRTPRVIALDGKHWDERVREPERKITMGTDAVFCPKCHRIDFPDEGHECVPFPARPEVRAAARAAAAEARGRYEREMGERIEARKAARKRLDEAEACAADRKAARP